MKLVRWLLPAFIVIQSMSLADNPQAEFRRLASEPFKPPAWLEGTSVPFTQAEMNEKDRFGLTIWRKLGPFQADSDRFNEAVATIHAFIRLNSEPEHRAKSFQMLATYYELMLNDIGRACYWYRKLVEISGQVKQVHDPQNHNMRSSELLGILGMARCYAKAEFKDAARQLLARHSFRDWRELLDLAIVHRILGECEQAERAIDAAITAGKQNQRTELGVLGRSIILFHSCGNRSKVQSTLGQYQRVHDAFIAKERKLPDDLAGHHAVVQLIRENIDSPALDFKQLANGVYEGRGAGLNGPIRVTVTIDAGVVRDVKVVEIVDRRRFNAAAEVPAQIVEKQSLEVDGITGASVSSQGILFAVRDALSKARK